MTSTAADGTGTRVADEVIARRLSGTAVERPREDPPRGVPVALRTVQHSVVSRGRFEPSWSKRFVICKWVIAGQAAMGVGAAGHRVTFGPGDVAVYLPSSPHRFWAVDDVNEMCWFSLDGPLAEQFMLSLDLRAGVYAAGPPPVARVHELMQTLTDHTIQGRRRGSLLAVETLYDLANSVRTVEVPSVVHMAQNLIDQEFADPDLSTDRIAARLGYHRGSLSRLFHRHTGTTMIEYITQVRLQVAKSLLLHSVDKVSEVGRKCGFREATYFCRWLRKHTGATPKDLRSPSQMA